MSIDSYYLIKSNIFYYMAFIITSQHMYIYYLFTHVYVQKLNFTNLCVNYVLFVSS